MLNLNRAVFVHKRPVNLKKRKGDWLVAVLYADPMRFSEIFRGNEEDCIGLVAQIARAYDYEMRVLPIGEALDEVQSYVEGGITEWQENHA